jgi:signal transduction histidine kinase
LEARDRASDIVTSVRGLFKKRAPNKSVRRRQQSYSSGLRDRPRRSAGTGISLQTHLDERLANLEGDKVQLQQAILNLFINGIDATSNPS